MRTGRIEAFSDGVIAVIITITVLDLKVPKDTSAAALVQQVPMLMAYLLSFTVVGIMWINHHHLMHLAKTANARIMWANNLLLFWMSLVPFTTSYLGNNHAAPLPVAVYGAVLTWVGIAFTILRWAVSEGHAADPQLAQQNSRAVRKSILTVLLYAMSVPLAFLSPRLSIAIFVLIPALYFLPERKLAELIERVESA